MADLSAPVVLGRLPGSPAQQGAGRAEENHRRGARLGDLRRSDGRGDGKMVRRIAAIEAGAVDRGRKGEHVEIGVQDPIDSITAGGAVETMGGADGFAVAVLVAI